MKLCSSVVVAAAFAGAAALGATAFQPIATSSRGGLAAAAASTRPNLGGLVLSSTTTDNAPCAMPNDVIPESVTAKALRTAILTNANGETVRLDEKMGSGTSLVIFLRHLG
jgi:hypothetical protein